MIDFARDAKYALRSIVRLPLFTVTVVVTLGFAIGFNSAMFSLVDTVLLKPLPFPDSDRIMHVSQSRVGVGETTSAPIRLYEWNELSTAFEVISGYTLEDATDLTGRLPDQIHRATVLPGFFDVLGVAPALGRGFTDAEHRLSGPSAVVISDRYWRSQFQGNPNVLGDIVRFENEERSYVIVGVMPASFRFPERDVDWWTPEWLDAPWTNERGLAYYFGIGRLRAGVPADQAVADLKLVQSQLAERYPDSDRDIDPIVEPLKDRIVSNVGITLWLLFAAVAVLLLIACTNIAALLSSRGVKRTHETAIRISLGATPAMVLQQILTEVAVLALVGAAIALLIAAAASVIFPILAPDLPRIDELTAFNGRMFAYTFAVTVSVTLICSLLPASRLAKHGYFLSGWTNTRTVSARNRLQWLLVAVQVSLSVILVVSAGLLIRSGWALSTVYPGFESTNVLTFRVSATFGESNYDRVIQRIDNILDELSDMPGIAAAASSNLLPGVGGRQQNEFEFLNGVTDDETPAIAESRAVSPGYFTVMQIPLIEGDLCRRPVNGEEAENRMQMMVNRSFANRFFPGGTAIGQEVRSGFSARVVGVVDNARETGIHRNPEPTAYFCFGAASPSPWYSVRTDGVPSLLAAAIRAKVNELEPDRAVYDIETLGSRIGASYAQNRLTTILLILLGGAALILACLGVFGTLSYVVSLRRREVGLRIALGARRMSIVIHYLRKATGTVGLACMAGVLVALALTRFLSGMLYGVSPSDPTTLAMVIGLVMLVATFAALVPSLRASRIEPMVALRDE